MEKAEYQAIRTGIMEDFNEGKITSEQTREFLYNSTKVYRELNGIPSNPEPRLERSTLEEVYAKGEEYKKLKEDGFTDLDVAEFFSVSTQLLQKAKKEWKVEGVI